MTNSSQKAWLLFAPSPGCAVGVCCLLITPGSFYSLGCNLGPHNFCGITVSSFITSFSALVPHFRFYWIKWYLFLPCNYQTPLSCFLATVKIPSSAITTGVRWELRGKNRCNEVGFSVCINSCSIISKIFTFSHVLNVSSDPCSLSSCLLLHAWAGKGFGSSVSCKSRGSAPQAGTGTVGPKQTPKRVTAATSQPCPWRGSTPEQGCQQRTPECSCTGPGSCTRLLCSQVCPSPVMLRCLSPSVTTTTSKPQEINGFSLSVICRLLGLRQPRASQLLQITSSRAGWLSQK